MVPCRLRRTSLGERVMTTPNLPTSRFVLQCLLQELEEFDRCIPVARSRARRAPLRLPATTLLELPSERNFAPRFADFRFLAAFIAGFLSGMRPDEGNAKLRFSLPGCSTPLASGGRQAARDQPVEPRRERRRVIGDLAVENLCLIA